MDIEFASWARSERLDAPALRKAAHEIEAGLVDARLGGFLLKKRIALQGGGKRDGYRTILCHRQADRLIFLFGFAKNRKDNINPGELNAIHELGEQYMAASNRQIDELVTVGYLKELNWNV